MTENKETVDAIYILWYKEGWTREMLAKAFDTSEKKISKLLLKAQMMQVKQ